MKMKEFTQDFSRPDFEMEGVHLVEASAGTGKTYSIQNIYARLVVERGYRVRDILVVTFTKAATRELKERLYVILDKISTALRGGNLSEELLNDKQVQPYLKLEGEARQKAHRNVLAALLEFDQAMISTIHGFCQKMLARYAFESGMQFDCTVEESTFELVRRGHDWWRTKSKSYFDKYKNDEKYNENTLLNFIQALEGHPGYRISDSEDTETAVGFLLQQAHLIVQTHQGNWRNRQTLSYNDLVFGLKDALDADRDVSGTPLVKCIRKELKAALIDEFQDTDILQYAIFKRIFLEDDSKAPVFFVGDPKQAIYSFRGGDIYAYRNAAKDIPEDRRYELQQNFRSTPRMLDAINVLFRDLPPNDYTFGDSTIQYAGNLKAGLVNGEQIPPLKSVVGGDALEDDVQPCHICGVLKDKGQKVRWDIPYGQMVVDILKLLNHKAMDDGCKMIRRSRTDDDNGKSYYYDYLRPGDIAVLVRVKDNAIKIRSMLREHGVNCVVLKMGSVFASQIAKDLAAVLEAVCSPQDKSKVLAALTTMFIGMTFENIAELSQEGLSMHVQQFQKLHEQLEIKGFSAAISMFERMFVARENLSMQENGERLLSDYLQLVSMCQNTINSDEADDLSVLQWLHDRIDNDAKSDSDAYQQLLETDEDAVKIMTLHASKGLQFPVVFMPDGWKKSSDNKESVFFFHDEFSRLTVTTAKDNDDVKSEREQEQMRLLYVGTTRAQQSLFLYFLCSNEEDEFSALLRRAKSEYGVDETPADGEDSEDGRVVNKQLMPSDAPFTYVIRRFLQDIDEKYESLDNGFAFADFTEPPPIKLPKQKGSYSSLTPGHQNAVAEAGEGVTMEDDGPNVDFAGIEPIFELFPGGKTIGDCWHDILEQTPFAPQSSNGDYAVENGIPVPTNSLEAISLEELMRYGFIVPPSIKDGVLDAEIVELNCRRLTATVDLMNRVFERRIKDVANGDEFSLSEIDFAHRSSEWEFHFPSNNAVKDTGRIIEILGRHWAADASKKPFVEQLGKWKADAMPQGYFQGFLDLIFCRNGRYYVVDWKSNQLNRRSTDFTAVGVCREMADAWYFIQYMLYSTVMHVYLKERLPQYSYEKHFGGVFYYFLRGVACDAEAPVFADRPSEALLDELAEAFGLRRNGDV